MIGKIKKLNFKTLICLISITIFFGSFYVNNFYILFLFILCFSASVISTNKGVSLFKKLDLIQNIQKEVLLKHENKKMTPTMGGFFIIPFFLITILIIDFPSVTLKVTLFLSVIGYFLIGFVDDFLSIKNRTNLGLSSINKFILQAIIAILFIFSITENKILNFDITLLNEIDYYESILVGIIFLTIVGFSNAVNLTDGLDGLATGCSAITFCGLGTEILLRNDESLIVYVILCYCLSGICLGFLKYNKYPAKIFLGDTGSLSLGAILGFISVLTNSFYTTILLSFIFIIETTSVILQVSYFKLTKKLFNKGKRLFLMTPLHHHYELKGFKEEQIVDTFWKINIICMFLVIVLKISF